MSHSANYIDGCWTKGSGAPFQSLNPATQTIVWEGNASSTQDIDQAISAARHAFSAWSQAPLESRIAYLEAFRLELQQSQDLLTEAISMESGKPLWESKTEVQAMIGKVPLSIDAYSKRCADLHPPHATSRSLARHKPHGVVAVFGPFNFPGHLPNGHIVPALLAGNTLLFKPSELSPRVAELTVQCWERAQLPPGVLNLVQGGSRTGSILAAHPGLNGLFFTGSFATGRHLSELFAPTPEKILALEMGGNNPLVVSKISDLQAASILTILSAYLTAGQRCSCLRRLILVEEHCPPAFLPTLLKNISAIQVGPYTTHPEPFMGPLISPTAADRLLAAQDNLTKSGAKPLLPMRQLDPGSFLTPGLIDVTPLSAPPDEEYFGPLLQLIRVPDFHSALQVANHTQYGLCAGLLSDSSEEYQHFYQTVQAGIINWNMPLTGASSATPFGGIGHSGNHRPSAFYAADYCSYPVSSLEADKAKLPDNLPPGLLI